MKGQWIAIIFVSVMILGTLAFSAINVQGYDILTPIPVGTNPDGGALNLDTNRLYVTNTGSGTVSVIDTTTNTVIDTIEVGRAPGGMALNPLTNRIYVVNSGSNNVYIIDLNTEPPSVIEPQESEVVAETSSKPFVPAWIKDVAKFWIDDKIDDSGFVQVIEYLVQQGIITIPYAEAPEGESSAEIPIWIKTSAEFWVNGKTSDDEFATALEWLINNGIIKV